MKSYISKCFMHPVVREVGSMLHPMLAVLLEIVFLEANVINGYNSSLYLLCVRRAFEYGSLDRIGV